MRFVLHLDQFFPELIVGHAIGFSCRLLYAGYLLGLLVNPKDRGTMFLRNVGEILSDYIVIYPSIWYSLNWV
jgi:hypothetical protein